jgi:hypothetical protein
MRALTGHEEIRRAFDSLEEPLSAGGVVLRRTVGYKGGNESADIVWHSDPGFWVLLHPTRLPRRYWCAFGVEDPHTTSALSITCEINSPKDGIDRRCAGLFVGDDTGRVFLAHSGKVGGGRPGIGKSTFLRFRGAEDVAMVEFPDGRDAEYIILGALDATSLLTRVAGFVHDVARFKARVRGHVRRLNPVS